MTKGLFPPNSKVTLFKFDVAAACMIILPTGTDPVNAIFWISMWFEIAAPAVGP